MRIRRNINQMDDLKNPVRKHLDINEIKNVEPGVLDIVKEEVRKFFERMGFRYDDFVRNYMVDEGEKVIKVYVHDGPGRDNPGRDSAEILTPNGRNRLIYLKDPKEAKYFLSNYRCHKQDYPYREEFFSIKIGDVKIAVVYKLQE